MKDGEGFHPIYDIQTGRFLAAFDNTPEGRKQAEMVGCKMLGISYCHSTELNKVQIELEQALRELIGGCQ
jgi:hypothetical protein